MIRYKPRGQYSGVMDEHKDGPFVLYSEAQAEIDALKAKNALMKELLEVTWGRLQDAAETTKRLLEAK